MGYLVSIEGTEHRFLCQEGESLLDEGLRAGLPLDYGCTAGSCGDCRARLVSGQVGELARTDYAFSESDKAQDWFLPCATTARSDLSLHFPDLVLDGELPEQHLATKVSKLEQAGDDVIIIHLKTSRATSLRFFAGQRVALTLPGLHRREFSIASCPCNGRVIQVHQCRIPGDSFSDAVFGKLRVGHAVELSGPYGQFRFNDDATDAPQLFIAFGTGFAAVKSLIEHALGLEVERPMHLHWFGFGEDGHYLQNVCRAWHDAFENFSFESVRLRSDDSPHCQLGFRVATETFTDYLRPLAEEWDATEVAQVYVSGPAELIAAANILFTRHEPVGNLL